MNGERCNLPEFLKPLDHIGLTCRTQPLDRSAEDPKR